jgi:diguanylate cyclase (GGDEF)-like protein
MSLTNQLIAAVFTVLLGLVLGTVYLLSDSSRDTLVRQLESHAEDGATHLGLYLAPYMQASDSATIATAVNAIFDSGFYQQIDVTAADGTTLYSKQYDADARIKAPDWFISLIRITPPAMSRSIAYQWQQVGEIHVRSRAGYAYERLWTGVRDSMLLFGVLALVSALLLTLLLRFIMRPLRGVEHQAMALARREYVEQPDLPRTRELRRVVTAMNLMVKQVQHMFEEQNRNIEALRSTAYRDSLTGLNNRRALLAQMQEHLEYRQDFGPASLLLFHLRDLQQLNRELGEEAANHLIKACANMLTELGQSVGFNVTGRLGGADLILLARQRSFDDWQRRLQPALSQIDSLYEQLGKKPAKQPILCVGIASGRDHSPPEQLMSQARLAVNEAEAGHDAVVHYHARQSQHSWSEQWQSHVAEAINNEQIFLQHQLLLDSDQATIHAEVFARILNLDNEPCSAGEFISVARDLGLIERIDRAIVRQALSYLRHNPDAPALSLNLANQTLEHPPFVPWLLEQLDACPQRERVSIEINETAILAHQESIQSLRRALQKLGVSFGVDNFGTHPNGFSYLYALRPDYLKVDGSLIRQLDQSEEDRFFVSSLISVAHSLEIKAYAEHVERPLQQQLLTDMHIDGTQGYLHGAPAPLP